MTTQSTIDAVLLKKLLGIDEKDVERLEQLHTVSLEHASKVIDDLYKHILTFPEAHKFFNKKELLDHVKKMQSDYFLQLTGGKYGEEYIQNRLSIGIIHERINLGIKWYLGAYKFYIDAILRNIISEIINTKEVTEFFISLLKIIFFDIILAIDVYISARENTIREQQKSLHETNQKLTELVKTLEIKNTELAEIKNRLEERNNTLEEIRQTLEQKVTERTADLKAANVELQKERNALKKMLENERLLVYIADSLGSSEISHEQFEDLKQKIKETTQIEHIEIVFLQDLESHFADSLKTLCPCRKPYIAKIKWISQQLARGETCIVDSLQTLSKKEQQILDKENIQSFFIVPLRIVGEVKAAIQFSNSQKFNWNPQTIHTLQTISTMISSAWERNYLFQIRIEAERKQLETIQIMEKTARLTSIGVMAGGITHEISQPLNAIKMIADSILFWEKRNKGVLPQSFIDKMAKISQGTNRIDEIIQHMRSFWVVPKESPQKINIAETIRNALSIIERQLYSHGIIPQIQSQGDVFVCAEPLRVEQVIINLVVNAMHSVDASDKKDKCITIVVTKENENAVIQVIDNGVGLPEGIQDQIFDPFYTTRSNGEGTGLGLAIVRQFMESLQGNIEVANNDQGGATFILRLPLAKDSVAKEK